MQLQKATNREDEDAQRRAEEKTKTKMKGKRVLGAPFPFLNLIKGHFCPFKSNAGCT